ncbi:MAG: FG-GAP repeat protein [Bdellovibrio sp.]
MSSGSKKFKHPSTLSFLIAIISLLFLFQNCQQFVALNTNGSTNNSSTSSDSTSNTTQDPQQRAAQIAECVTLIDTPSINSVSLNEVTVQSGLSTGSGDVNSNSVSITVTNGIKDAARIKALSCSVQTSLRLQQLSNDTSHAQQIVTAIDLSGNQAVPSDPTAYSSALKSLVANSVTVAGGNNKVIDPTVNSGNVIFQPVRGTNTNQLRCVQGVAWYQVITRTEITDTGGVKKDSAPQIIKVNLNNNCWAETRMIPATELPRLVQYGTTGDIKGNLAVILAPKENSDAGILEVGTAYVFEKQNLNWVQTGRIQISDAAASDTLTSAVIFNDLIILGSRYRDQQGSLFVYGKSGGSWALQQKILPTVNQTDQQFGATLATSGNYIFSGAPGLNSSGGVYVFEWSNNNFIFKQTLYDQKAELYKGFGSSLSVDGSLLAVGAPQAVLHEPERAGEVQLFNLVNGTWVYSSTLSPASTVAKLGMRYGNAVSVNQGKILVGACAYSTSDTEINRGAAFYFATSSSVPVMLTGDGGDQLFGQAVAITDTGILVGSPYKNTRQGTVNFYKTADIALKKVARVHYSQDIAAQDNFGNFIGVSGTDILIGARSKSSPNSGAGAAYIYVLK